MHEMLVYQEHEMLPFLKQCEYTISGAGIDFVGALQNLAL